MKTFILTILLALNVFALEKLSLDEHTLSEDTKVLLESISKYAIKIGEGTLSKTYVFVDPMCPHSKKFIQKISENKKAQKTNTYYIFLYKLPKFDSDSLTQYILQSSKQTDALQEVMLKKEKTVLNKSTIKMNIQKIMNNIANVGKKLHIKLRPHIIDFEKGSKYCRVSSGTAPCLEENDF